MEGWGEGAAPTLTHVADGAHPASDQVSLGDLHSQAQVGDPNVACGRGQGQWHPGTGTGPPWAEP